MYKKRRKHRGRSQRSWDFNNRKRMNRKYGMMMKLGKDLEGKTMKTEDGGVQKEREKKN